MVLGLRANFVSAKESDETMAMAMGSLGWASTKTSKHQLWKNILPHSFNYRHNPRKSHSSSSSLWDLSPTNWGTQLCKHVTAFASGMGEIGGGREQVSGFVRASSSSAATTMKGDQKGEEDLRCEATHTKKVEEMRGVKRSRKVAVIGCGASGLVAARELLREGHQVSVFEQGNSVGGVWVYDPEIETDLLGINVDRKRVHSSMYASLRTNLPREIMSFTDFPFLPTEKEGSQRDTRRFPGHPEVASYLQDFAEHYGLMDYIHFSSVVEYAGVREIGEKKDSWKVRTRLLGETTTKSLEEDFDAVVVCNGHYSEPYVVPIPGIREWPGRQMHSHNYREPHSFADQIVVVIGNAASGTDIARELADFAKEVHISGRTWSSSVDFSEPDGPNANIWRHSVVECACEDGIVKFKDGGSVQADVILHCTGYLYSFPFLDSNGKVSVDNNCVGPLYEHVFAAAFGASLSFVGLPWKVVPFPICELQSRWVAMALSGRVELPPVEEMMQSVEAFYAKLEASGKSKRLAHNLSTTQFQYVDWLADQTGSDHLETWRKTIYEVTSKNKRINTETYRDVWPDEDLHQEVLSSLKTRDVSRGDLSSYHLRVPALKKT